jgi:uncharacterized protein
MKRIGLLSDTHGYWDESMLKYFSECDEIWHSGDFGSIEAIQKLQSIGKTLKGVYGNIDGQEIRFLFPEINIFNCEDVKVMIKHIGGYPPKYTPETKAQILTARPQLFISGHSHILKIMYDDAMQCLYINPGAAGKQGWHKVRTLVRFTIDEKNIKDCEVVELGKR